MAERFRDLVRPALIDVGARSTPSGGAEASLALAQSLSSFSRVAGNVAFAQSTKRGTEEGAAVEGTPEFKTGLRALTAYGQAYNNAALRSYAIRVETDLTEQATRLEIEAGTNPESFRDAMTEMRKAVLEEAPVEAHALIGQVYDQRTGEGLGRIQGKLAAELRAEDRILGNEQTNQFIENIALFRAQDTIEAHERSQQEEIKLDMLINSMVADGTISEVEGEVFRRDTMRQVISETVKARFDNELSSPVGDPIGFIKDLKELNRTGEVLPPEDEDALVVELFGMLQERNALRNARASEETASVDARFEAGDRDMTIAVLSREAGTNQLIEAMADDRLRPARGLTLFNVLTSGSPAKSDPKTLAMYEINLLSYDEEDILTEPGLTWDDRSTLVRRRDTEAKGWKGTQRAREAFDRVDRELGIVAGTPVRMLSDDELRARERALTQLYDVIEALPPEEREAAIFEETERVVRDIRRVAATTELIKARETLAEEVAIDPESLDRYDKSVHDSRITRLENRIRELEQIAGSAN